MKERIYYYLVVLLTVGVLIVTHCFQSPITLNEGQGYDGIDYCRTAECLKSGQPPTAKSPYVYRIGTPILAATLPKLPIVDAFHTVNLMACLLVAVAAAYWFRMWITNDYISLGLVLLYITQWHAPIRFVSHYPAYVDPWFLVFFWTGLILIESIRRKPSLAKTLLLYGVIAVGTLFRESIAILGVAAMFMDNPMPLKWPFGWKAIKTTLMGLCRWRNGALLLVSMVGIIATHAWCISTNQSGSLDMVYMWAYQKPLLIYLESFFVAFGPAVLILVFCQWRSAFRYLDANQYLAVILATCLLVGWIGGSDTERLLYWSAPVVLVLAGLAFGELWPVLRRWKIGLSLLVIAQLISQRVFWTLPDLGKTHSLILPIFTIPSSDFEAIDLAPCFGRQIVQAVAVAEYLVFFVVMLLWLTHFLEQPQEEPKALPKQSVAPKKRGRS